MMFRGRLYRNDLEVRADGGRTLRFTDVTEASGLETADHWCSAACFGDACMCRVRCRNGITLGRGESPGRALRQGRTERQVLHFGRRSRPLRKVEVRRHRRQ